MSADIHTDRGFINIVIGWYEGVVCMLLLILPADIHTILIEGLLIKGSDGGTG